MCEFVVLLDGWKWKALQPSNTEVKNSMSYPKEPDTKEEDGNANMELPWLPSSEFETSFA